MNADIGSRTAAAATLASHSRNPVTETSRRIGAAPTWPPLHRGPAQLRPDPQPGQTPAPARPQLRL